MILVEATPATFDQLLGGAQEVAGYRVPPGGVAETVVLEILRTVCVRLSAQHDRGSYMMVADGTVVGLCGYKAAPLAGTVEIGYGVAEAFRRQGFATSSLALLLERASGDPAVSLVIAHTVPDNHASRRVLERNRFVMTGAVQDPEDGLVLRWIRPLQTRP
jgi:RimJ/RimL family protein N-acetyltransferase